MALRSDVPEIVRVIVPAQETGGPSLRQALRQGQGKTALPDAAGANHRPPAEARLVRKKRLQLLELRTIHRRKEPGVILESGIETFLSGFLCLRPQPDGEALIGLRVGFRQKLFQDHPHGFKLAVGIENRPDIHFPQEADSIVQVRFLAGKNRIVFGSGFFDLVYDIQGPVLLQAATQEQEGLLPERGRKRFYKVGVRLIVLVILPLGKDHLVIAQPPVSFHRAVELIQVVGIGCLQGGIEEPVLLSRQTNGVEGKPLVFIDVFQHPVQVGCDCVPLEEHGKQPNRHPPYLLKVWRQLFWGKQLLKVMGKIRRFPFLLQELCGALIISMLQAGFQLIPVFLAAEAFPDLLQRFAP